MDGRMDGKVIGRVVGGRWEGSGKMNGRVEWRVVGDWWDGGGRVVGGSWEGWWMPWGSSRVATGISGTGSCCLREVRSLFELRGARRDSSQVAAGE